MAWLKIDDGFPEHEKVIDLSDRAFRVHMTALCQCAKNLTDGAVPAKRLSIIHAIVARPIRGAIRELVAAGLWIDVGNGNHVIKDYLDYNPPAVRVKDERRKARERMRSSRERSGERSGERSAEQAGERSDEGSPTPSRPVPSRSKSPKAVSSSEVNGPGENIFKIPNLLKEVDAA